MGISAKKPFPKTFLSEVKNDHFCFVNVIFHSNKLFPQWDRKFLGNLIEALIERYDYLAGDCDLEEDDPCGGNVDDEGEAQIFEWIRYRYHPFDQRIIFDDELYSQKLV